MLISLFSDLNNTDLSEETAALVDLVENGAYLLRTVDSILKDVNTVSEISGSISPCTLLGILRVYDIVGSCLNFCRYKCLKFPQICSKTANISLCGKLQ